MESAVQNVLSWKFWSAKNIGPRPTFSGKIGLGWTQFFRKNQSSAEKIGPGLYLLTIYRGLHSSCITTGCFATYIAMNSHAISPFL